jgi:teichoic acid transport system ATP-binding protein
MREVHAVKGVSFVVYEGETVGIVGSNGSGKSSLMRAIAGLFPATKGAVYTLGKPTMLGVGAALLPNLSGEKNIMLGGLALGFDKKEIAAASESIISFSGLKDFIDLPMRTYSQGMSARLRFSIAAAKKHDILIIDEALAVGDRQFRMKAEAKIREMRQDAGTVFLVSHNMKSIQDTCNRVIWLEKGELLMDGDPVQVCDAFIAAMDKGDSE